MLPHLLLKTHFSLSPFGLLLSLLGKPLQSSHTLVTFYCGTHFQHSISNAFPTSPVSLWSNGVSEAILFKTSSTGTFLMPWDCDFLEFGNHFLLVSESSMYRMILDISRCRLNFTLTTEVENGPVAPCLIVRSGSSTSHRVSCLCTC